MNIPLPKTYRRDPLQLFFAYLLIIPILIYMLYLGFWPGALIWGIGAVLIWFILRNVRITLTEQDITFYNLFVTYRADWSQIKRIVLWSSWWNYQGRLRLLGDQGQVLVQLPVIFESVEMTAEILTVLKVKAPQSQRDPQVQKFYFGF